MAPTCSQLSRVAPCRQLIGLERRFLHERAVRIGFVDPQGLDLKSVGNKTVKPDELARSVLRLAMEGERDPVRLHDGALERLLPATTWREAS